MKAVLLVSHGSRFQKTAEEVRLFVANLKVKTGLSIVEYAFLDVASPTIPQGIDACAMQGATKVIVLLNFLNAGRHVDEDIPHIIDEARVKYPGIKFRITKPIGQHQNIADLFLDMIDDGHPQE